MSESYKNLPPLVENIDSHNGHINLIETSGNQPAYRGVRSNKQFIDKIKQIKNFSNFAKLVAALSAVASLVAIVKFIPWIADSFPFIREFISKQ